MEDVHQLKVFSTVAAHLSFTRAAESLLLTQSAVSHQVASLERLLGAPLFDRRGRTVTLTPAGRVLADGCRRVFAALEEAEVAVRAAARPGTGRLRIGASATACQYLLPEPLRELRESFPEYALSITPGDSPAVVERVLEGSIDLGLVVRPEQRTKLEFHDLFEDELGFVVAALHPWARAGRVERRDLTAQRMVLYSRGSHTLRMVEKYLLRMNAPPRDAIELGSMEAIKELVKLGLGVSMMAEWVARAELSQRSLAWLPTPGAKLRRRWCVAAATGRPLSLAEQTFIGLCQAATSAFRKNKEPVA